MEDEFNISILDSGDPGRVVVLARCGVDMAIQLQKCDELNALKQFNKRLVSAASGREKRPHTDQLADFGHQLFEFLVRADVERMYSRLPNTHMRLQIYSNRSDLQSISWEYLQQRNTGPSPNSLRSIVRIVPTIGVPAPTIRPSNEDLSMLFVQAEPVGEVGVAWLDIKETIEREFQAQIPNRLQLDVVEGANYQTFMQAFDGKHYDVLHFAGHGEIGKDGTGALLFEDRTTRAKESIGAAELGAFLRNKGLRLIVLSACNSSSGDFAKEFATVAKTLVESSVPCVVANQFPITNSIATAFAGGFYRSLIKSGDVDVATMEGRLRLGFGPALAGNAARFEWGIPTLYRHVGAARTFGQ